MSQIIKSFLGLFLLLSLCSAGIAILALHLHVMQAQNLHADIVNELENSAFQSQVLKECFDRAESQNCRLNITLYDSASDSRVISKKEEIPEETETVVSAKVELYFGLLLPFTQGKEGHVLSAYAF